MKRAVADEVLSEDRRLGSAAAEGTGDPTVEPAADPVPDDEDDE